MASFRKRAGRWQAMIRRHGQGASATFDTKAAAQKWARRIEAQIDQGRALGESPAGGTVAELLKRYEIEGRKIRSFGRSKLGVIAQLESGLGKVPLRRLSADDVLEHCRRRQKAGAGPVTVGLELSLLGTALRAAHGLLGRRLTDQAVREARVALKAAGMSGKSRERERRPTPEEVERLCRYFRELPRQLVPMAEIIEFAIASAMRREEILRLRWADLRADARTIVVRDRKDPRRKHGNDETVPLLAVTGFDALGIILRQERTGETIFPYRPETVTTTHARACGRLGIADLRFHDYRHHGISLMFEAGMKIEEVAMVSGHKDWRTLRRYTHLKPEDLARRWAPAPAPPANAAGSHGDREGSDPS